MVVDSMQWLSYTTMLDEKKQKQLSPNSLIFSFSSVASIPSIQIGWAGRYYHYVFIHSQERFLTKELDKHHARRISSLYTIVEGLFGCCAVDRHIC